MSGLYVIKLIAGVRGKQAFIRVVVRDDARSARLLFQSSVTTDQAYNNWGGKSMYSYNSTGGVPACKVSFNRPYETESAGGGLFSAGNFR